MIRIVESKPNGVVEFVADARTDVDNLPTDVGMGSDCFIIADSSVLMFGSDGIWHYVLDNSGGGGGGEMSFDNLSNIYYMQVAFQLDGFSPVYNIEEDGSFILSEEMPHDMSIFYIKNKVKQIKIEDNSGWADAYMYFIPSNDFNMDTIEIEGSEITIPIYIANPDAPQEELKSFIDLSEEKHLFYLEIIMEISAETGEYDYENSYGILMPVEVNFADQVTQFMLGNNS